MPEERDAEEELVTLVARVWFGCQPDSLCVREKFWVWGMVEVGSEPVVFAVVIVGGWIGGGIGELCEMDSGIRKDASDFRELSWHLWGFKSIYVGGSLFENNLSGCIVPPEDHA